jgi:cytochrome P450
VPSLVICELLGVPYADHDFFQRSSKKLASLDTHADDALATGNELRQYLLRLVDAKNADPGDDMISRLVVEQLRTGSLTRDEIATIGIVMLGGGHETTANMIGLGTLALLRNPDQPKSGRPTIPS